MILSTTNQSNLRWLRFYILLVVVVAFPLSLTYAHDFDAVERRLGEAVSEGEITLEQASIMMDALRDEYEEECEYEGEGGFNIGEELREVSEWIKEAVATGEMTEKEALQEWEEFKEEQLAPHLKEAVKEGDMDEDQAWMIWKNIGGIEVGIRLKVALTKGEQIKQAAIAGEITEEQAWKKWQYVKDEEIAPLLKEAVENETLSQEDAKNIWHEIEKAEAGNRLKAAVHKGEMTEEQARAKWEEFDRNPRKKHRKEIDIEARYADMGIDEEGYDKILAILNENGIEEEKAEQVLGGMLRIIYQMGEQGEDFEFNPKMKAYFEDKLELSQEQIELATGIARRISYSMQDSDRDTHESKPRKR